MLISLCTPVMNRTRDLKHTMHARLRAAGISPPVEFVILDYNSKDDLAEYVNGLELPQGVDLTYKKYSGREYYHQAHAYNLSVLAGSGEYFSLMGADTYPLGEYFNVVRSMAEKGYVWMEDERYKGAIACRMDEFIAAGGFDERFETYGPEDRDLAVRLSFRNARKGVLPHGLIGNIPTSDEVKMQNYRIKMSKQCSSREMRVFFEENIRNRVTVANPDGWGRWT